MSQHVLIELQMPEELAQFKLPHAVDARLQTLLDRGGDLTPHERSEAEGLVHLAELLSLIQLRAQRAMQPSHA